MESIKNIPPADLMALKQAAHNLLHWINVVENPKPNKAQCRLQELQRTKAQLLNRKKIKS